MTRILDSRDLEKELNELEEAKENKEDYDEKRLNEIQKLKEECQYCGWEYGITFIPVSEWEDYCRELAEDCGYISRLKDNPLEYCIDWERWAEQMTQDYSTVDFDGDIYYYYGVA